jgi:hypothetical protein
MILFRILFFILITQAFCQGQDSIEELFGTLEDHFKAFEYEQVIQLADKLSTHAENIPEKTLIEILRMQAIAFYSIDQTENAEKTFIRILNIDENFELASRENSPKIISFFNDIKLKFLSHKVIPQKDAEKQKEVSEMQSQFDNYKNGMLRSLVWPGWGHYHLNESGKARLLNIAALITLAPGIYYAFETVKLEKDYLNASDPATIKSRYNKYNDAYNYRNYLLTAFSAVWLYAQYDYFFTDHPFLENQTVFINPQINPYTKNITLNLTLVF